MHLGTRHCTWPVFMARMPPSASWLTAVPTSASRTTRASPRCTLLLPPLTELCVWSYWSTTGPMSMYRYQFVLIFSVFGSILICILLIAVKFDWPKFKFNWPQTFVVWHFLTQSRDGKSPLHMTAVHGRFTRSQTLIQNGKPGLQSFFSSYLYSGGCYMGLRAWFIDPMLRFCDVVTRKPALTLRYRLLTVRFVLSGKIIIIFGEGGVHFVHFVTLNFIKRILLLFKFCRRFHIDAFVMSKNR